MIIIKYPKIRGKNIPNPVLYFIPKSYRSEGMFASKLTENILLITGTATAKMVIKPFRVIVTDIKRGIYLEYFSLIVTD
ncbi:hypothetical protein fsci_03700 [Francisella sciaenopsi]|uniref:Uncharacterized protein n=1 Tax=Francisella sciaenopsi TaxID=3055034 RepID=A0ABQ6PEI7_9GAMM